MPKFSLAAQKIGVAQNLGGLHRTPMDQGNDLMGKLAASIQIHFDAHPSSEIAEKFRSLHASVLDFQKKMLGPTGPQVFIFGRQNKTVF